MRILIVEDDRRLMFVTAQEKDDRYLPLPGFLQSFCPDLAIHLKYTKIFFKVSLIFREKLETQPLHSFDPINCFRHRHIRFQKSSFCIFNYIGVTLRRTPFCLNAICIPGKNTGSSPFFFSSDGVYEINPENGSVTKLCDSKASVQYIKQVGDYLYLAGDTGIECYNLAAKSFEKDDVLEQFIKADLNYGNADSYPILICEGDTEDSMYVLRASSLVIPSIPVIPTS